MQGAAWGCIQAAIGCLLLCVLQEGLEAGLEAGAPVDARSSSGYTPLHVACFFGLVGCCRLLLEHGANADLRSRRGSAAIHFAAQQVVAWRGVIFRCLGCVGPTACGMAAWRAE